MNDLPAGLVREFRSSQVAVFVGAGASVSAGMPTWLQLVDALADDLGMYEAAPAGRLQLSQLSSIPQYYENRFGRKSLTERLRTLIPRRPSSSSIVHGLIADLPSDLFYTTNFDTLLEASLEDRGRDFETVATEDDAKDHTNRDRCQVRKIHGSIDTANSLVITRDDFLRYDARHPHITERLRTDLATTTFLFVGYSLDDQDFSLLYDRVFLSLAPLERRHYITVFGANAHQTEDLRRRGLEVIDLDQWHSRDATDGLVRFLAALGEATSEAVHIRRLFGSRERGTEIPTIIPSYIHPDEKYEYFPRMDLQVARALDAALSLTAVSSEVHADADIIADNPDEFLRRDCILVGSPRGNKVSEFVFDNHRGRMASLNDISVEFVPGEVRALVVRYRDEEQRFEARDSGNNQLEGDQSEYAVIARFVNPWRPDTKLWLMAGLWGLGTQAISEFISQGQYRNLPWQTEGSACSILEIRYNREDESKGQYRHSGVRVAWNSSDAGAK